MYRLMVKLPAIALERTDFTFRDAWAATRDNYWRILGLVISYMLVALTINLVVSTSFSLIFYGGAIGVVLAAIVSAFLNWVGIIFGISLLTTLYGFFVENRDF